MTLNLDNPTARFQLAQMIREDIDAFAAEKYDDGFRRHLGASVIGHDCLRNLWYVFNWVYHKKHEGRMQRLFQRGHREEAWLQELLEGIGCTVKLTADDGKQLRVSDDSGHFGGSLDMIVTLPDRYGLSENAVVMGECKTQGTGRGFADLQANGVRAQKPQHYAQMMTYGTFLGLKYALYVATNKNDDDMHVEVVPIDPAFGLQMKEKAHKVIWLRAPPLKLATTAVHPVCKFCDFKEVCHQGHPYAVNCRSCKHSQAAPGGEWGCHFHGGIIPADFIPKGCGSYEEKR